MDDYQRIERIIRHLDEHHAEQPDLARLAGLLGLSAYHFQRLFSRWAGVSPKAFVKCLTLEHVRQSLREGESVLNTAIDAGLSGPGRLHDLCVSLEAASPGEVKSGGDGWTINAGFADTPFGTCLVGSSPRGVCHLSFVESRSRACGRAEIAAGWPRAQVDWDDNAAKQLVDSIFTIPREKQDIHSNGRHPLRALVRGTQFQVRVWRALLAIPSGTLVSYGRLAEAIGSPAAARAVGTAIGHNPLGYLIPCHRVIRETGIVGEYRWSRTRKLAMIAWENALATR